MPLGAWIALAVLWGATASFAFVSARAHLRSTGSTDRRDLETVPGFVALQWCLAAAWGVLLVGLRATGHSWWVVVFWLLLSMAVAWLCAVVLVKLSRRG